MTVLRIVKSSRCSVVKQTSVGQGSGFHPANQDSIPAGISHLVSGHNSSGAPESCLCTSYEQGVVKSLIIENSCDFAETTAAGYRRIGCR